MYHRTGKKDDEEFSKDGNSARQLLTAFNKWIIYLKYLLNDEPAAIKIWGNVKRLEWCAYLTQWPESSLPFVPSLPTISLASFLMLYLLCKLWTLNFDKREGREREKIWLLDFIRLKLLLHRWTAKKYHVNKKSDFKRGNLNSQQALIKFKEILDLQLNKL